LTHRIRIAKADGKRARTVPHFVDHFEIKMDRLSSLFKPLLSPALVTPRSNNYP